MEISICSLANKLNLDRKELVEICAKAGVPDKAATSSTLTEEEFKRVIEFLICSNAGVPGNSFPKKQLLEHYPPCNIWDQLLPELEAVAVRRDLWLDNMSRRPGALAGATGREKYIGPGAATCNVPSVAVEAKSGDRTKSPRVFISYRRTDSAYVADMLNRALREKFGSESVFFDIDNIPLGVDFRTHIGNAVAQCDVLLVLIGDRWIIETNSSGTRRLDDESDFVRIEIESALKRSIPVIPVLVGDATMPPASELPDSIRDLVFRNGGEVRAGRDLQSHIGRLIRELENILKSR